MNLQELKARKEEIETNFNKLNDQATAVEQEKLRLQGEYRTIEGFIEEMEAQDVPKSVKAKKSV